MSMRQRKRQKFARLALWPYCGWPTGMYFHLPWFHRPGDSYSESAKRIFMRRKKK